MPERVVAHADLDAFYASVEVMINPNLRDKPVAVCGSVENRHGIILAKSQMAKKAGVKTAMAAWEAQRACPGLILVPPQYDEYIKMSRLVRGIYERYTNEIEPYGMDEAWLGLTGSQTLFGTGEQMAQSIQKTVYNELGLTVSIGVANNKVFAKLASDMNKPNGITVLTGDVWKEKVWSLPVSDLLFIGNATTIKLMHKGIHTIGDLAALSEKVLKDWFGKNGSTLWAFANGLDTARVMPEGYAAAIKTCGHGITCSKDILTPEGVWLVMLDLAQDVGRRLRENRLDARGVEIMIRGNDLGYMMHQCRIGFPTQSPLTIARRAYDLFTSTYKWERPVRAITIRAISLEMHNEGCQLNLEGTAEGHWRRERMEDAVYRLRERFGDTSVFAAALLEDRPMPQDGRELVRMPGLYFQ